LKVVAKSIDAKIYEGDLKGEAPGSALVERLAKEARREAASFGFDTLIVDTAGRLHIDEDLMGEMERLKKLLNPQEILFVADAMTGQDAVNSAQDFHKRLGLTGVIPDKDGRRCARRRGACRFAMSPASRSSSSAWAKSRTPSSRFIPTASSAAFSAWATCCR
jgi:signal recognition particle GTPase